MTNSSATIAGAAKPTAGAGSVVWVPPLQCSWQRPGWSGSIVDMSPPVIACAQGIPAMEVSAGLVDCMAQAYAAEASCKNSSEAINDLDHQVRALRVRRIFTRDRIRIHRLRATCPRPGVKRVAPARACGCESRRSGPALHGLSTVLDGLEGP